ncbi:MAG: PDDEXK nuclease domain-containing protein [Patescibacteria group bacterium]
MNELTNKNYKESFEKITKVIDYARNNVVQSINVEMAQAYFEIGRVLVEDRLDGEVRGEYGSKDLEYFSIDLNVRYGKGFSIRRLQEMKRVYLTFGKTRTASAQFDPKKLSWSIYLVLSSINDDSKRDFYYLEAIERKYTVLELKREMATSLYERTLMAGARERQLASKNKSNQLSFPKFIKQQNVLEFLGLEYKTEYSESELEQAIIDNLEKFMLEFGKGFSFVRRQYPIPDPSKTYHADLLFYNRYLNALVVVDLKIKKMTHGDVGQIRMYRNYIDKNERIEGENPVIAILLCVEKDDFVMEYSVQEGDNIYAAEYTTILPNKEQLLEQVKKTIEEVNNNAGV